MIDENAFAVDEAVEEAAVESDVEVVAAGVVDGGGLKVNVLDAFVPKPLNPPKIDPGGFCWRYKV